MPWAELESLIEPFYPEEGNGRPPVGLGIMLRICFLWHWFNLSDPAVEEACAIRQRRGVLPELIWAAHKNATRRPSRTSDICWSSTICAEHTSSTS